MVQGDFREFLQRFRTDTERYWANFQTQPLSTFIERGVGGTSWCQGTVWTGGMSDQAIQDIEKKWNIRFPDDYRMFLSELGVPDRKCASFG